MKKLILITSLSFILFGCKTEAPKEQVINLDSLSEMTADTTIHLVDSTKAETVIDSIKK